MLLIDPNRCVFPFTIVALCWCKLLGLCKCRRVVCDLLCCAKRNEDAMSLSLFQNTVWGGNLFRRLCEMFSAVLQLPCCPSKQRELSENILHNVRNNKLPPPTVFSSVGKDKARCEFINIVKSLSIFRRRRKKELRARNAECSRSLRQSELAFLGPSTPPPSTLITDLALTYRPHFRHQVC